jgi:hypothetical protein
MTVTIRAYNADGYHKDILCFDEKQVRMSHANIEDTTEGMRIEPDDFPEAVYFMVVIERK